MDDLYYGRPCTHNHVNDQGKTVRNRITGVCVECTDSDDNPSLAWRKKNPERYKQYQQEYHKNLRLQNPKKLDEYKMTQLARGHVRVTKPGIKTISETANLITVVLRKGRSSHPNLNDIITAVNGGLVKLLSEQFLKALRPDGEITSTDTEMAQAQAQDYIKNYYANCPK